MGLFRSQVSFYRDSISGFISAATFSRVGCAHTLHITSLAIVEDLVPCPKDAIIEKHGDDIWDAIDHDVRQWVPHEDLDNLEGDARLFTDEGYKIQHYYPIVPTCPKDTCGVLVDFNKIQTLFNLEVDLKYLRAGPDVQTSKYFMYPQAGLRMAGHVQVTSLISDFYPLLE